MGCSVTSSSSYSSSSEVKTGNSEVRRVPGIGFSSCAAPTFSRVQGILNGGRNGFPECVGMEICTGMVLSTSTKMRGMEVRSSCGSEVHRMHRIELSYRKSRVERDEYELGLIFRMQKHT